VKIIVALSLLGFGMLCFQSQADEQRKSDAADLVGVYRIVSGEKGGKEIPQDHFKDITVRVAANAITTFDKNKKELYAATYELDTTRKPWAIMMTATITPVDGEGTQAPGLVEIDDGTVKLIYALPQGKAPTRFETGEHQQMFVLEKSGD
jgi:uncharacterized protein (TIGR03067 family)